MVITVTNTKGGVGKTTTAANLAVGLGARKKPTLLIDLDPQAHATSYFLSEDPERDVGDLIMDRPSQAGRTVLSTDYQDLDIVPASERLTETAELISGRIRREERLSRTIKPLVEQYYSIVIDCPPALGILTYNAIIAADFLLIPVQPGSGAVAGLDALLDVAGELREEEDVPYRIVITMFDSRTTRTNAVFEGLMDHHKRRVLKTIIRKSESLNQANMAGKPVSHFPLGGRGAEDYDALCQEILRLRVRSRA